MVYMLSESKDKIQSNPAKTTYYFYLYNPSPWRSLQFSSQFDSTIVVELLVEHCIVYELYYFHIIAVDANRKLKNSTKLFQINLDLRLYDSIVKWIDVTWFSLVFRILFHMEDMLLTIFQRGHSQARWYIYFKSIIFCT